MDSFRGWFNEGVDDMLAGLSLSPDTRALVMALSPEEKQWVAGPLKRNPGASVQDVQALLADPKRTKGKSDPNVPQEHQLVAAYPEGLRNWLLINLRKLRGTWRPEISKVQPPAEWTEALGFFNSQREAFVSFIQHNKPDLAKLDVSDAMEHTQEWAAVLAGGGRGKFYGPNRDVIYGPQWDKEEYAGWTIQKVNCENDLEREGSAMNHCVGGYGEVVKRGDALIYSLRDPQNKPHVTMEYRPKEKRVVQIMGVNNDHNPKDQYVAMMAEWLAKERGIVHTTDDGDEERGINPIGDLKKEIESLFKKSPHVFTRKVRGIVLSRTTVEDVGQAVRDMAADRYDIEKLAEQVPEFKKLLDIKQKIDADYEWRDKRYKFRVQPSEESKESVRRSIAAFEGNAIQVMPERVRTHIFSMYQELLRGAYTQARKLPPDDLFRWIDNAIEAYVGQAIENDKKIWRAVRDDGYTDDDYMAVDGQVMQAEPEVNYVPNPESKRKEHGHTHVKWPKEEKWRLANKLKMIFAASNVGKIDELAHKLVKGDPASEVMLHMPRRKKFPSFTRWYNHLGVVLDREGYDLPPFEQNKHVISFEFSLTMGLEVVKQAKRADGKFWFMD